MEHTLFERKRHYQEDFDPKAYRDYKSSFGDKYCKEEYPEVEKIWSNVFEDPEVCGQTLIDIGSGPTVHGVAPACHKFTDIVLADYIPANIEELKKFVRGDPDALDWTKVLKKSAEAQGYKDPDYGAMEIQEKIRKCVKAVIYCDLLSDQLVPDEYKGPYDMVITSLTVESAAPDYETYKMCFKKLNSLLSVGGHLLVRSFLMGGKWRVGDHEYPHLKVTQKEVQTALEEAGFVDLRWNIVERKDMELYYEFTCISIVRATKSKDCSLD